MVRRIQLSATQLAGLAILGSVLFASVFLLPQPLEQWFHTMGWLGRLLVTLPFFVGGMTVSLMSESRFKNGIQNGIWSDEEVAPLRALLTSPLWTVFSVAMLIASGVLMFIAEHQYRGIGWALFLVGHSATRLQMAFRKPTPKNPSGPPSWTSFSPIQSNHWGER